MDEATPETIPMPLHENVETVNTWVIQTFGTNGTDRSCLMRARQEALELELAIEHTLGAQQIIIECADIAICLIRYMQRVNLIPNDEILYYPTIDMKEQFLDHALECSSNLHRAVRSGNIGYVHNAWQELHYITYSLGVSLWAAIDRKMKINRQRQWKLDGYGHGQHVEDMQSHNNPIY